MKQRKHILRIAVGLLTLVIFTVGLAGCGKPAPTLEDIQLMTPVSKTQYLVGETFDPTGLTLVAVYSDGSREPYTDFTYDKTEPLTQDDTVVTISAGEYTFETPIEVITPGEQVVMIAVNGVDTLEMFADGHLATGRGNGNLEPDMTAWSWDGENLRIWLTVFPQPEVPEDHLTEMTLVKHETGDITFEYDLAGKWHMNYTLTASSMEGVLTPDARYPIEE